MEPGEERDARADAAADPDPATQREMLRLLRGYTVTQIAGALAELGVADALDASPRAGDELAETLALPSDTLRRLLRAAASVGLVEEPSPDAFRATARSELLAARTPGSLHAFARNVSGNGHWSVWGRLADAIRSGEGQAPAALGASLWEHYGNHPDEGRVFAAAMSERTVPQTAAIVGCIGPARHRRIVDVGGSTGVLLAACLAAAPGASGVLVDRPEVVTGVAPDLGDPTLAGRVELAGGDFFAGVPAGADAYLLKLVLHDWPDAAAVRILRAVRAAIAPDGLLYVVELVVPPAGARGTAHVLDLSMLVSFGGRERTADEYRDLLGAAGFRLDEVRPLANEPERAVMVARPV